MEQLSDIRVFWSAVLALPVGMLLGWLRLRERLWLLSSRRKRAARRLFKQAAWRKAAPLDLHFALEDAFGRGVESIELAFIERHQSPVRMLLDRIEAGHWLGYEQAPAGYVDARRPWLRRWLPFGVVSLLATMAAGLSLMVFLGLSLHFWQKEGARAGAILVLEGAGLFVILLKLSVMAEAARRILAAERYLPAIELPAAAVRGAAGKAGKGGKGGKSGKRKALAPVLVTVDSSAAAHATALATEPPALVGAAGP